MPLRLPNRAAGRNVISARVFAVIQGTRCEYAGVRWNAFGDRNGIHSDSVVVGRRFEERIRQ